MCNQLRFPASLLPLAAIVPAALALTTFFCPPQGIAQIVVGPVIIAADLTQPVPGTCANYDSVLSATGVLVNGQSHPGHYRSTALTPLFWGMQLGSDMQSFLNSPKHPVLFTIKTTQVKGGYCAVDLNLRVKLTASLQATRLQWTSAPTVGSACTAEVARVNAVSSLQPSPAAVQATVLNNAAKELQRSPQLSGCGPTAAAAKLSLDQLVWNLLQKISHDEITTLKRWRSTPAVPVRQSATSASAGGWEAFNAKQPSMIPAISGVRPSYGTSEVHHQPQRAEGPPTRRTLRRLGGLEAERAKLDD